MDPGDLVFCQAVSGVQILVCLHFELLLAGPHVGKAGTTHGVKNNAVILKTDCTAVTSERSG